MGGAFKDEQFYIQVDSDQYSGKSVSRGGIIDREVKAIYGLDTDRFQGVFRGLRIFCASLLGELNNTSANYQPSEIEMTFGLQLTGSGNMVVTQGTEKANFSVKVKWSSKTDQEN
ncbi:MAG TPA: hypothetical protein DCF68_07830 [Cyanothece sp. UBA12306]|nr:hypothetical protein [Cyanothece sp. UBA12306]